MLYKPTNHLHNATLGPTVSMLLSRKLIAANPVTLTLFSAIFLRLPPSGLTHHFTCILTVLPPCLSLSSSVPNSLFPFFPSVCPMSVSRPLPYRSCLPPPLLRLSLQTFSQRDNAVIAQWVVKLV